jgi:hypothetical protein
VSDLSCSSYKPALIELVVWLQDEHSRNGSIWERMCKHKQPIIEPREAFQFKLVRSPFVTL